VASEIRWHLDAGRQRFADLGIISDLRPIPPEFRSLSDDQLIKLFSSIKETIGTTIIMPVVERALAGQTLGFRAIQIQAISMVRWQTHLLEQDVESMKEMLRLTFTITDSTTVIFNNQSQNLFDYLWFFGDGDSSTIFARSFKNASIIAFEPVSETCELFRKKTVHLSNIKLLQKAISDKIGKIEVNVTENFKSSSILKLNADYNKDIDFSKNLSFQKTETVEMSTLDIELENYNNIDLIKLDVQGAELQILKGASQTLKHTNIILTEMSNHDSYINSAKYFEVDAYLRNNDFKLYDLIPAGRNKDRIYEWNAVYLHDKCFKDITS